MNKNDKTQVIRLALRIVTTLACLIWAAFILSNSLKTSEQSSTQSAAVVETVQKVAKAIAPQSKIANATGEAYDMLHVFVRNLAHFGQFAVLGALLCWCYFAYTLQVKHFYLPILGVVCIPIFDEWIQGFVAGRSWELIDLALDICGGFIGLFCAMLSVYIGCWVYKRKKRKAGTE